VGTTREERIIKEDRRDRKIATWYVQTLLQCSLLDILKIVIARMIIDILGVSEIRWPEAGDIWRGEYRFI